jgi:hypothetical protein
MMHLFLKITAVVAVGIVALIVLAFVLKIVIFAAIVAALVLAGIAVANLFRRRGNGSLTTYDARYDAHRYH